MRLLWLSHFLPYPPRGGNLQRTHHLLRQAARANEVHLVALNQRAILPNQAEIDAAIEALRPLVASISVHKIPSDRSRLRWAALVASTLVDKDPYLVTWLRQP